MPFASGPAGSWRRTGKVLTGVSGSRARAECRADDRGGPRRFCAWRAATPTQFLERLRAEHDTSAVPGRFFGMPECFRVGMGVDSEMFAEGLRRIEEAL